MGDKVGIKIINNLTDTGIYVSRTVQEYIVQCLLNLKSGIVDREKHYPSLPTDMFLLGEVEEIIGVINER